MTLNQVINIYRKVFTFRQFVQLAELLFNMAQLSDERQCDQHVNIVFRNGHVEFVNATDNIRMPKDGQVMGDDYQWGER